MQFSTIKADQWIIALKQLHLHHTGSRGFNLHWRLSITRTHVVRSCPKAWSLLCTHQRLEQAQCTSNSACCVLLSQRNPTGSPWKQPVCAPWSWSGVPTSLLLHSLWLGMLSSQLNLQLGNFNVLISSNLKKRQINIHILIDAICSEGMQAAETFLQIAFLILLLLKGRIIYS